MTGLNKKMKIKKNQNNLIKKFFNLLIYILRYFSIVDVNYNNISDNIDFGSKDANLFFVKSLKKSKYYLEYGSGNSTFLSKKYKKKFLSIETDKSFYRFLKRKKIKEVIYSDIGPTKYYSIPILPTILLKKNIINYANLINFFKKKFKQNPDLILIDGRFRVYVALKILIFCINNIINKNIIIIIDDFKYRKNYHIIKKITKIKLVGRMGVMKINKKTKLNQKKIKKNLKKYMLSFI